MLLFTVINIITVKGQEGFSTIENLVPLSVSTNTADKPQSKIWMHDGKHYTALPTSTGTHLWRLDGLSWTHVLKLSSKTSSKVDCKKVGNLTHLLLFQGASSQLISLEYLPNNKTYQLWSKRSSTVGLNLHNGVETATIDIDGTGRMWLAYDGPPNIFVKWSDAPYNTWSEAITLATGIVDDDICSVIALPGKIGVMWSNQNTKRFGFKTHNDGDNPNIWSEDEVPASQSAQDIGGGMADDHINMAVTKDGTLFCAVKTEYDRAGYPVLALLVRRPSGTWDDLYGVAQGGTRPIVLLNEEQNKLSYIYTARNGGGNIRYCTSPLDKINFSAKSTLISGTYDNPTSTKDNYTSEIVILASSNDVAVGVLAVDGILEFDLNPPLLKSPENLSSNLSLEPILEWHGVKGANSYHVQVSTTSDFSSTAYNQDKISEPSVNVSGLSESTLYYWRVRASNDQKTGEWSDIWRFTTREPSKEGEYVAFYKFDEGKGNFIGDASDYKNNAEAYGHPTWIDGAKGKALRFNGSDQFATVQDHPSLDLSKSLTIALWIKPERVATQYLVKKAEQNSIDGYELSLASTGKVFFRFNQNTSGNTYRINSRSSYPSDGNTWMHVAVTYDGSTMTMYIDGEENKKEFYSSSPTIIPNHLELTLGAGFNGFRGLQGSMDEVYIFDKALNAEEVKNLATLSEIPILAPPPILEYPVDKSIDKPTTLELRWMATEVAETYHLQVSTSSEFSSFVYDRDGIKDTSVPISSLGNYTTYYWRVRSTNAAGTSDWSSTWSFTTLPNKNEGPLVAHWKMDEENGILLLDDSGYGNNAVIVGNPMWVPGMIGSAMKFSGINQYAIVADHNSLDVAQAFTVATWIKPEKQATQYLIKKAEHNKIDGYELSLASTGKVFFRFNQSSSGDTYRLNSKSSYPSDGNTWMHVAVTYNGSIMKMYINGMENSSKSYSNSIPLTQNDLNLSIGAEDDGFRGLQGVMDDVRIYNTALEAADIKKLSSLNTNHSLSARLSTENLTLERKNEEHANLYAYPNPFSYRTSVSFSFSEESLYNLTLFDSRGIKIAELLQGEAKSGEVKSIEIEGTNLASGLYLLKLQTEKGKMKIFRLIVKH